MTPPVDSSNTENPKFGIGNTGGSQPHTNMQPYLCVHFIISLWGIFPSQT
jgi:microcystin-dependent protein